MSDTVRRTENVRSWYRREAKWARKSTNRQARGRAKAAIRTAKDYDEMIDPRPVSTGGWITH